MADVSDIQAKLDYLDGTKAMIKEAIINKGQYISEDDNVFRDYVDKIYDITTSSNFLSSVIVVRVVNNQTIYNVGDFIDVESYSFPSHNVGDFLLLKIEKTKNTTQSSNIQYLLAWAILQIKTITNKYENDEISHCEIIHIFEPNYPEFISNTTLEKGIRYGNDATNSGQIYNWYSYAFSELNVTANDVMTNKKFIGATGIETGTIANNGILSFTPSDSQQIIPAGYTSGGTISPMDITTSNDYNNCLALTRSILGI